MEQITNDSDRELNLSSLQRATHPIDIGELAKEKNKLISKMPD
ncbi:hypothetical protein AVDCRST_MAG92-2168 [uncultured Coleofasciculus sp.]|uniref:Uncharacterized protein n=1 Tax=uncultured Coleofasciculus sp. TaxID=1267456 RepID=A0A6J4IKB7_9CYAN|nr:hypothetical protein AVDCRST_MAG92-2168 [uncultured Coleofasciculus sp.]